jgi:peptide/nickel transport system substrate-binding protein
MHNGDDFNADDVIFNFTRWMDPAVASSQRRTFDVSAKSEEFDTGGEERGLALRRWPTHARRLARAVDDHTVKLNLSKPVPFRAGGSLQLPDRDRSSQLQAAV